MFVMEREEGKEGGRRRERERKQKEGRKEKFYIFNIGLILEKKCYIFGTVPFLIFFYPEISKIIWI